MAGIADTNLKHLNAVLLNREIKRLNGDLAYNETDEERELLRGRGCIWQWQLGVYRETGRVPKQRTPKASL